MGSPAHQMQQRRLRRQQQQRPAVSMQPAVQQQATRRQAGLSQRPSLLGRAGCRWRQLPCSTRRQDPS